MADEPAWSVPGAPTSRGPRPRSLFLIVFSIATTGLVYELGMAAVASYILGDTVSQFSLVIGAYLSALGVGAYLSRFVVDRLALTFIDVELATALLGGLSAPALLVSAGIVGAWELILYLTVGAVGVLVGLELPLLIRVLEHRLELKDLIAKALTFDYVGALAGSLSFSLLLVPELGLIRGSILCGLLNAGVGFVSTFVLANTPFVSAVSLRAARVRAVGVILVLILAGIQSEHLAELADAGLHPGEVVHAESSRYQRIVLSQDTGDLRLFLNGNLQFSSRDERRYHEALVHPALSVAPRRNRILIAGGGDGLALREVLRLRDVGAVVLVDLDPAMTALFARDRRLTALNQASLDHPKVRVVNDDAMMFLAAPGERFDVAILDFPDPSQYAIGKLYSLELYRRLRERLTPDGVVSVQATSPLFARRAFWCIERTLASAGFHTLPYHVFVPAFGEWGFVLAGMRELRRPQRISALGLHYLDADVLAAAFVFPPDLSRVTADVNRVDNQALVHYYAEDWQRWQ